LSNFCMSLISSSISGRHFSVFLDLMRPFSIFQFAWIPRVLPQIYRNHYLDLPRDFLPLADLSGVNLTFVGSESVTVPLDWRRKMDGPGQCGWVGRARIDSQHLERRTKRITRCGWVIKIRTERMMRCGLPCNHESTVAISNCYSFRRVRSPVICKPAIALCFDFLPFQMV
jgi:hypothetical protein